MRRVTKERKFIQKVTRMVRDIEAGEVPRHSSLEGSTDRDRRMANPSLADCWRWLKGLLYDFINLKHHN